MRNYLRWSAFFALVWWTVLLPKHTDLLEWLEPLRRSVQGIISLAFGELPYYEDSSGMYVLLFIAPLLGLLTALITRVPAFRERDFSPACAIHALLLYTLILVLWEYGWAKLTKAQFYLPEPNTVYTPLGALSKDIAYWSVMGSSRAYVLFMGVVELLAGSLLAFRRTRFIGLLLALGIFVNVCMVNFAFDISVKLFALSLLAMTVALLARYREQWRGLLQLPAQPPSAAPASDPPWKRAARALALTTIVIGTVHPSIASRSLNDDTVPRPAFHNAYRVRGDAQWKALYVHRYGYFILEDHDGRQQDRKVTAQDRSAYTLLDERTGTRSAFLFARGFNGLTAIWRSADRTDTLRLEVLPYRDLPLLQPSFHWCADEYH